MAFLSYIWLRYIVTVKLLSIVVILFSISAFKPGDITCFDNRLDSLIVIGNDSSTPDKLSYNNLLRILKGQKPRWEDGGKINLALMKPKTKTGETTADKFYGMTVNELNKFWLAMVFQGKTTAPKFFNDETALIKYVNNTEGAIGVISHKKNSDFKALILEGKSSL